MFTSPLTSLAGWGWTPDVATNLPDRLAVAFPPSAPGLPSPPGTAARPLSEQLAVRGSGPVGPLRFPASGRWHHAQQTGTDVHWIWGQAADVLTHGVAAHQADSRQPDGRASFRRTAKDATADSGDPKGVASRNTGEARRK